MFEIVVICTGNRNRSPIAEEALRQATQDLPVAVSSVGLLDLGPAPPLPETIQVAEQIGLDISSHRARFIKAWDLTTADLLLGLEWQHVAAAVVEEGAPSDRAFTLLELIDLLRQIDEVPPGSPIDRARSRVKLAHEQRGSAPRPQLGASVQDPFGGPIDAYLQMGVNVRTAALELTEMLFRR